jgi:hypothetical protein
VRTAEYLARFFDEKGLESKTYEVEDPTGLAHFIPTEVVVEHIHAAPNVEQRQIADILRRIDFLNGDVHHFLNHLAGALAANYAEQQS